MRTTRATIGGWTLGRFREAVLTPSLIVGVLAVFLVIVRSTAIYAWASCLLLFIWLGVRIHSRGGHEVHYLTLSWLVGAPLGFVIALVMVLRYATTADPVELIRFPFILAILGTVIASGTGHALRHPLSLKHLILGDLNPPKRHNA